MKRKRSVNVMLVGSAISLALMFVCVLSFIGIGAAWGEEPNAVFCLSGDELTASEQATITIEPAQIVKIDDQGVFIYNVKYMDSITHTSRKEIIEFSENKEDLEFILKSRKYNL